MEEQIRKFRELPVDPGCEWHGGTIPFQELPGDWSFDSQVSRTEFADTNLVLWLALDTDKVHSIPEADMEPFDLLVQAMVEFADTQPQGRRPARIGLTSPEHVAPLQKLLEGTGTSVTHEPEAAAWNEILSHLGKYLTGSLNHATDQFALAKSACTDQQVRDFAEAAAAFYRTGIWQYLSDTDLLEIMTPRHPRNLRYVTVLGAGRHEYGLGFYDSPQTLWKMRSQQLDLQAADLFNLTYDSPDDVPAIDLAMWEELDLPLASGDAYPIFLHFSPAGGELPDPQQFEFATLVLKALAQSNEADIDSGEWTKQVTLGTRNRRCKISIPDLLDPPHRRVWIERGLMPEPRGNERHFRQVQSFIEQHEGMDLDQLNRLINERFTGSIDDFDYPSDTPFDRAENLCFEAIDNYGRRRIQLARQALEEFPGHVEANNLLAESTFDPELRIRRFEAAVEFGRQQNHELLKNDVGNFWEISGTRPFIRALHGLANALDQNGQRNEAIAHMLEILRLNSNDNLGVRYEIMPLLLTQNRTAEAVEILERYPEETASWLFLKAQLEYHRHGPAASPAQTAIRQALRFNPHVPELLMAGDRQPAIPEHYSLRSPEEAAMVIEEQMESWLEMDGFVEWMFARQAQLERDAAKRRRQRERKQRTAKKKNRSRR